MYLRILYSNIKLPLTCLFYEIMLQPLHCHVSVQIKHKNCPNMKSAQQQCKHQHQKVLIESFHLSGHTFRFRWMVQDLEVFLVWSHLPLAVKGLKQIPLKSLTRQGSWDACRNFQNTPIRYICDRQ